MKIKNINLPSYNQKEELINGISHLFGVVLAILIVFSAYLRAFNAPIDNLPYLSIYLFATAAFLVYLISSVYHLYKPNSYLKKVLRLIDHMAIYLLIAGTYTPVGVAILPISKTIGLTILISEWSLAVLGILINLLFFNQKWAKLFSYILYIVMGWLLIFTGGFIYINKEAFLFILIGGVIYTIGAVIYALGKRKRYFHSIFHFLTLISTLIQAIGVFLLF